ncbi:MAG: hypothetical protein JWP97_1122 [Labilithrix sp.]|nr:hypothetical protein [Labilithrix sp.]
MTEPQRLTDFRRIFVGDVPWVFAVEVVVRIAILYVVLLVAMRLMGKRMATQTTRNELASIVSLAGAMGPAMQDPRNGILPSLIIVGVVVALQRLLAHISQRHGRFERLTQGAVTTLVEDGVICWDALRKTSLSRQRVLSALREAGVENLGAVDRVYLEINGAFTIAKAPDPRPGLSLVPTWDEELARDQERARDKAACRRCGALADAKGGKPPEKEKCERCGAAEWEAAVT